MTIKNLSFDGDKVVARELPNEALVDAWRRWFARSEEERARIIAEEECEASAE